MFPSRSIPELFDANQGRHQFADTTYWSRGAWLENASQYGTMDNCQLIRWIPIITPTRESAPITTLKTPTSTPPSKYASSTPKDSAFLQIERVETTAGDVNQYYNEYSQHDPNFRSTEMQDPNFLLGYHRQWSSGKRHPLPLSQPP